MRRKGAIDLFKKIEKIIERKHQTKSNFTKEMSEIDWQAWLVRRNTKMCTLWHEEGEKPLICERFKNVSENIIHEYVVTNVITWKSIIE